jgi:hypothetical protein
VIGVDKGYSEVFADSEGDFHGEDFGKLLTAISNARTETNKKVTCFNRLSKSYISKRHFCYLVPRSYNLSGDKPMIIKYFFS